MRSTSSKLAADRERAQAAISRATAQRDKAQAAHTTAHEAWRAAVLDGADSTRLSIAKSHTLRQLDDANAALIELRTVAESVDQRIAAEQARADHAAALNAYAAASKARVVAGESLPADIEKTIDVCLAAVDALRSQCVAFDQAVEVERSAHAQLTDRAAQIGELPPGPLSGDPANELFHRLIDVAATRLFGAARRFQRRDALEVLTDVLIRRMDGPQPAQVLVNLATPVTPIVRGSENSDNRWLLDGSGPHGLHRPPLIR